MKAAALLLALSACMATATDRTTLAVSTALLAVDWRQTRAMAADGWSGTYEGNPLMGASPDPHGVDVHFGIAAAANAAMWSVMPRRWRSIVPIALSVLEAITITRNAPTTGWIR